MRSSCFLGTMLFIWTFGATGRVLRKHGLNTAEKEGSRRPPTLVSFIPAVRPSLTERCVPPLCFFTRQNVITLAQKEDSIHGTKKS